MKRRKSSKKILLLAVILILLNLVTTFGIYNKYDYISKHPLSRVDLVKITDKGFVPKNITVQFGSQMTFENLDKNPHWVASDHHPTHEIYPEFDSKIPIQPGQSWDFIIKTTGKVPYHDHLNPDITGTITIRGGDTHLGVSNQKKEATDNVTRVAREKGGGAAWDYFKKNYPQSYYGGHDIAHLIGRIIFDDNGLSGLSLCDPSFAYGCFHGFIEELIRTQGLDSVNKATKMCLGSQGFAKKAACVHGVGHALLPYYAYEVTKALPSCDKLVLPDYQDYCYTGIFMENAQFVLLNAKYKDDLWPCTIVNNKYKAACYRFQQDLLFSKFGAKNYKKVIETCQKAESENYIKECLRGVGDQIAQANSSDMEQAVKICNTTKGILSYYCVIYAAQQYSVSKNPLEKVNKIMCDSLPGEWISVCTKMVIEEKVKSQELNNELVSS